MQEGCINGSTILDAQVENNAGNAGNATSVKLSALFSGGVVDATGEFDDAMMYLDTKRAGRDILVTIELG
jgi:hypothetical protein